MPFDGIVTSNMVWELNSLLSNGKIEKIYQPESDEITLHIRANGVNYKLLISSSSSYPRLHLMNSSKNNPPSAPNFCMFLRKHIQGGRISSIIQRDFERIVEIHIESYNELGYPSMKKLIVEIMGKHSNIILIDAESNKILDSIKKISIDVNRYRQILPGKEYVSPPDQSKISPLTADKYLFKEKLTEANAPIIKSIYQSFQGMSPFIARQICELADIDEDMPSKNISEESFDALYYYFSNIVSLVKNKKYQPCLLSDEMDNLVDFYSFPTEYAVKYYKIKYFDSISMAVEAFYFNKDTQNRLKQKSADLHKHVHSLLDKLGLKKQRLLEEIMEAEKADSYRLYGELINANLYRIQDGSSHARLENYYNPGEIIEIPMDEHLSPSENAQKYFKKYNKAKKTYKEKLIQLEETNRELDYLESVFLNIEDASSSQDIEEIRQELIDENYLKKRNMTQKNKKVQSQPLSFTSSEGYAILVGKNNKQNDILTLKTAAKSDIWLHTKEIPGSHVIIVTQGKKVPEKTLLEAAALAAYHSKGKMSENVPVDYTLVKNVRKPNGAKPGMVIYDNHNTVYVNPKESV
ncbi:MAG: fibronectin/fibrinogen-binding protein [Clostridiales bacterium]|nr:fibronectin/fibrinogen-binding protein [Clostridiales bacterium]